MVLVPQAFRLSDLMRGSKLTFDALAKQRNVHLCFEQLSSDLDRLVLVADMRRLQQVLNNGLSNRCIAPCAICLRPLPRASYLSP